MALHLVDNGANWEDASHVARRSWDLGGKEFADSAAPGGDNVCSDDDISGAVALTLFDASAGADGDDAVFMEE